MGTRVHHPLCCVLDVDGAEFRERREGAVHRLQERWKSELRKWRPQCRWTLQSEQDSCVRREDSVCQARGKDKAMHLKSLNCLEKLGVHSGGARQERAAGMWEYKGGAQGVNGQMGKSP